MLRPQCPSSARSVIHLLSQSADPCPLNVLLAALMQRELQGYFGEKGTKGKTICSYCRWMHLSTFHRSQKDITSLVRALTSASCVTPLWESSHNSGDPVTEKKPFLPQEAGITRLADQLTCFRTCNLGLGLGQVCQTVDLDASAPRPVIVTHKICHHSGPEDTVQ